MKRFKGACHGDKALGMTKTSTQEPRRLLSTAGRHDSPTPIDAEQQFYDAAFRFLHRLCDTAAA